MTRDELRKHCERTCNRYGSAYINGNSDKVDRTYEEHNFVLKLLDQEESVVKALEDVKAEIEDIDGITEIGAQILDEVLGIINRKIKEKKHE